MFPFTRTRMTNITAADLQTTVSTSDSAIVVDVREPWEYKEGHLKGSLLRPLGQIRRWAQEFDKEQEIILICRTGSRSAFAYKNLESMGFSNLKNVAGGIVTWKGSVERGL